jgi:hypothetical protein
MDQVVRGLRSRRYGSPASTSEASILSEIVDEKTCPDQLPSEGVAAGCEKRPKPAWWLLYAVLPLTILLFSVAHRIPATSGWRVTAELMAALVVICAVALWVRVNRTALILARYDEHAKSIREWP